MHCTFWLYSQIYKTSVHQLDVCHRSLNLQEKYRFVYALGTANRFIYTYKFWPQTLKIDTNSHETGPKSKSVISIIYRYVTVCLCAHVEADASLRSALSLRG